MPSSAKHRSRLHFHLAQQQAPPNTWPLMVGHHGDYVEAPGANLMFVRENQIYYCEREALPGISMKTVQDLTSAHPGWFLTENHYYHHRHYAQECLQEIWLTGTPFCMLPVVSLDGRSIGDGKPGPVFKATLQKWSNLVGLDIQQQIEEWDAVRVDADQH
jgi:branched-chain amino acid aminotransferase